MVSPDNARLRADILQRVEVVEAFAVDAAGLVACPRLGVLGDFRFVELLQGEPVWVLVLEALERVEAGIGTVVEQVQVVLERELG